MFANVQMAAMYRRILSHRAFPTPHWDLVDDFSEGSIWDSILKGNKMNKSITTILGLSATFAVSMAATFPASSWAATSEKEANYKAAKETASTEYKLAKAKCDGITGNPKDVCIAEAKAARVHTEATAKAAYKDTVSARTSAAKDIADADYDVEKTKCGSMTGNEKDVCVKQASSNKVAAVANAKADKKVIDALVDANEDKRNAEYKVAVEKCDALAGAGKDNCVMAAKSKFGK